MLTPRARIQLGTGRADTDRLTRRAVSSSLDYPLLSHWRGIVEYLFPDDGMVRRGDVIARVYDPAILTDLERARRLMSIWDVSPLTIAAPTPRLTADEAAPAIARVPSQDHDAESGPSRPAAIGRTHSPASAPAFRSDFDFDANSRAQDEFREQARLTAEALAAAVSARDDVAAGTDEVRADLSAREYLHECGALSDEALDAARKRLAAAEQTETAAENELAEVQEGYGRIARQIRSLEDEAQSARDEIEVARASASVARVSEPIADAPPIELREEPRARRGPHLRGAGAPVPREVRDLAAPRYQEIVSPAPGMIADLISPEGQLVDVDDELLRLSNIQLARLTARVAQTAMPSFREGRALTLTFEDYPGAVFDGWIASAEGVPGADDADVEILVVCDASAGMDDAYLALQWMVLEAGMDAPTDRAPMRPVMEPEPTSLASRLLSRIFPLMSPADEGQSREGIASNDLFEGRLVLHPVERMSEDDLASPEPDERLAALGQWRRSYLEGMVTTVLDDGTAITYPAEGDVSDAVRRMLTGSVSHGRNLCARTMREALGWGLGDAHSWAYRLPHRGYTPRTDGLIRPGDILVWPFTYGPGRSEHIGVAVRQGRRLVLLSNLSGRLGTSPVLGGYVAFYHPDDATDES
jgi:murein DD-endopeptidase MepM/ murein hydrolase activator NlpD